MIAHEAVLNAAGEVAQPGPATDCPRSRHPPCTAAMRIPGVHEKMTLATCGNVPAAASRSRERRRSLLMRVTHDRTTGLPMSRGGLRFLSAALACAVFLVDVLTPLEGAVAVLYVVVILLAARTTRRNDIIAAAVGCVVLTIAAYLLSHNLTSVASPALRALVSLAAIAITT